MAKTNEQVLQKLTFSKIDEFHLKEYGQTYHSSLTNNIRACNDKCELHKDGNLLLKGWVLSETDNDPITGIRVKKMNDFESKYLKGKNNINIERSDVKEFYNSAIIGNVGYELNLNGSECNLGDTLLLECKTKKNKVFRVFESVAITSSLCINSNTPNLLVIDNFYNDPMEVRRIALKEEFKSSNYNKGKRTETKFCVDGTKERLEALLGLTITDWEEQGHNMVFQYCVPSDPLVYHFDGQTHAAVVFLTPDAPPQCGTSFYRHKNHHHLDSEPVISEQYPNQDIVNEMSANIGQTHDDFLDGTKWEEVDRIGNKFNRLAMWDAKMIHAATQYFGTTKESGRLFHMFFFNCK